VRDLRDAWKSLRSDTEDIYAAIDAEDMPEEERAVQVKAADNALAEMDYAIMQLGLE
jgi:hypothetical protein